MGNDASKRKPFIGTTIQRIGIDDVDESIAKAEEAAKSPPQKVIVTLSTGQELTRGNVCEIFQQLIADRSKMEVEAVKPKKKAKDKAKLDYERCQKYLGKELVFILKDKELRDTVLDLNQEAFEALLKSDELVVPDESYVLLMLGAWAERRAYNEEERDTPAAPPSSGGGLQPPVNAVNMRGSDGLFQALGEGAAKLLDPKASDSGTATTTAEEEKTGEAKAEDAAVAAAADDAKEAPSTTTDDGSAKTEAPQEKALSKSEQDELEVNLRGTAGLYATFAGAYVNMISDEEMARKLQNEEEEEDKVRRKLMEEEDEKLARALQDGEIADGGALPSTVVQDLAVEEEEDLEPIPDFKLTPEYIDRIKKHMRPLVEHIRFSMLPLPILNTLANEMLVPTRYLTEAYKYHMLASANLTDLLEKGNIRYKRRRYICSVLWDSSWHGQHVQVSADGKIANKTQASWYSIACASEGFQHGKHFWAIKVDGDEAYIGVTQKGNSALDNYLGGNAQSWAFRTSYKYSNSHGNGHYGDTFGRGDVIGVLLDMDLGNVTFFKNGKNLGLCFTGLPRNEKLYPAVGWRAGHMTLVDIDPAAYPGEFISTLIG